MNKTLAIDAHCHLSDLRVFANRHDWMKKMNDLGIAWFAMGGVNPVEWDRQNQLCIEYPTKIIKCFGLHPYYVSETDPIQLKNELKSLEAQISQCDFLGELGLDFRKEIVKNQEALQISVFRGQLELAQRYNKKVVLHVVRAHEEVLRILKEYKVTGLVHSFNSSVEVAKNYIELGYCLSLGAPCLRPQHGPLVTELPLESLLIESDAPDQPPRGLKEHDSATILLLAQMIADNKGLTADQVIEKTRVNFETLLGRRLTC